MPPQNPIVILWRGTGQVRLAGNISGIVDPVGDSIVSAKSAEVLHATPLRPNERMGDVRSPAQVGYTRNLPSIVETGRVPQGAA